MHEPSTTYAEAQVSLDLEGLAAAADRVRTEWSDYGHALSGDEVGGLLDAIVGALAAAPDRPELGPHHLRSILGRRLLTLLRAELVRAWRARPEPPSSEEMLDTLAALEELREALEPDWDQQFASRLAGPDGLALVIEVAHDLRSPLTSILFLAETLQRGQSGPVTDLQHRQLGLVYSAALGLSQMASNVIELARGGSRLSSDPSPFSVSDVLESVADIARPMAEEKGLSVRLLPPTGDHRMGHPDALSRVLLNLTTNALKFTHEGSVEITGRATTLDRIEFSVRDTGPGIPEAAIETLYLPFRRAAGHGDRYAFSGTGLGLSLSRKLVEAMGGELAVETRAEWGTRFYFELELATVA